MGNVESVVALLRIYFYNQDIYHLKNAFDLTLEKTNFDFSKPLSEKSKKYCSENFIAEK